MLETSISRKVRIQENIMRYFSFSTIVILIIGFTVMRPAFIGPANLTNLLRDPAPLLIMAAGMTAILLMGSIDLSMGAVCSVANVLTVVVLNNMGPRLDSSVATALLALVVILTYGALAGLLLGTIHVKLKVPSFIASLAFMHVWQSVALLITAAPQFINRPNWGAILWFQVSFGVFGLPLIIAVLIVVFFFFLQKKTPMGVALYAIGGNERASRLAGIKVDKTKIMFFMINGMCAALAGFFLAANLRSSAPRVGEPFTLLIVTSVVLGGTVLTGGKGNVLGTILGVFTVTIILNGMSIVGVGGFWQTVVFGIFILVSVAISVDRSTRGLVIK
ncbi:MAG: ABC transporter permease [Treponema sp.]|nr:ABC transporter permease [Treponema sp.]